MHTMVASHELLFSPSRGCDDDRARPVHYCREESLNQPFLPTNFEEYIPWDRTLMRVPSQKPNLFFLLTYRGAAHGCRHPILTVLLGGPSFSISSILWCTSAVTCCLSALPKVGNSRLDLAARRRLSSLGKSCSKLD